MHQGLNEFSQQRLFSSQNLEFKRCNENSLNCPTQTHKKKDNFGLLNPGSNVWSVNYMGGFDEPQISRNRPTITRVNEIEVCSYKQKSCINRIN